jgi:uncharacterized membrane protein YdbT with pleckstrin-like domain
LRSTLREGEETILQVEKHWVVLIKSWTAFAGSVILLATMLIANGELARNFLTYLIGAVAFAGLYLWYAIAERRVDIWVVTNLRVIDESGIITQQIKESPLDKINNIQYRQTFAGRILDFGDVEIQTAAEQGATINQFVSHPKLLHDTVVVMQGKLKDAENANNRCRYEPVPRHDDEVECVFCAEVVKKKAKVCKHCGRELMTESRNQEPQDSLSDLPASDRDRSISMPEDDARMNPRGWLKQ